MIGTLLLIRHATLNDWHELKPHTLPSTTVSTAVVPDSDKEARLREASQPPRSILNTELCTAHLSSGPVIEPSRSIPLVLPSRGNDYYLRNKLASLPNIYLTTNTPRKLNITSTSHISNSISSHHPQNDRLAFTPSLKARKVLQRKPLVLHKPHQSPRPHFPQAS